MTKGIEFNSYKLISPRGLRGIVIYVSVQLSCAFNFGGRAESKTSDIYSYSRSVIRHPKNWETTLP